MILLLFFLSTLMDSPHERRPVIAIGGIMHESDTFNPAKAEPSDFVRRRITLLAEALVESSRRWRLTHRFRPAWPQWTRRG
jgi:hypothetical protein